MFRNRNEELYHLIEVYQTLDGVETPERDILRNKIDTFSTEMIMNMLEDKALDLEFAIQVYEFDGPLFLRIFKTAISEFYGKIGFKVTLRIICQVKYFLQAIEGCKTLYEQMKDNLPNLQRESYELRENLKNMTAMKDFEKLPNEKKSQVVEMLDSLTPYANLPEPVKSKRVPNWAEYYLRLAYVENSYAEEQNQFYSLFRTEE